MGGKAKFQKHTAKDLAERQKQSNKGGGGAGIQTRLVPKLNFTCDICMVRSLLFSLSLYMLRSLSWV